MTTGGAFELNESFQGDDAERDAEPGDFLSERKKVVVTAAAGDFAEEIDIADGGRQLKVEAG